VLSAAVMVAVTLLMVAVAAAILPTAVDILASEAPPMVAPMAVAAAVIPKATAELMEAVAVVMVEGTVMVVAVAVAVMVVVVMVAVVTVVVVMVAVLAVVTVVVLVVVTVVLLAAVMVVATRAVTVAAQVDTAETAAPVTVVAETRGERRTRTTRAGATPHMLPPELVVGRALMARRDPADQGAVLLEAGMALEMTPEDTAQAATQAAQAAGTPTDHTAAGRIEDCGETSRCGITTQTTILREHCNLYAFYCFGDTLFYGFFYH